MLPDDFFWNQVPVPLWTWIDIVLGMVAFVVSLITLLRVSSVRAAQRRERALMQRLYGTDDLVSQLQRGADKLASGDVESRQLSADFIKLVGEIEGTTRALESGDKKAVGNAAAVKLVVGDYFTIPFLENCFDAAHSAVDLLIYRNIQISNVFLLEKMQAAARRGIQIRILALGSTASDQVLDEARSIMPRPIPLDSSTLRQQLESNEILIAKTLSQQWLKAEKARFGYRRYDSVPGMHFARVDSTFRMGFIGTVQSAQPPRYEERPYILLPEKSPAGKILRKHFDDLWKVRETDALHIT